MSSGKRHFWLLGKQRGRDLVKELAQPIVARLAPEELEDFDQLAEAYFVDPRLESDEMLADGLGLLPDLVVALSLVAMTLDRLLSSGAAGSAESRLDRLIKALHPAPADSTPVAAGLTLKDVERSLAAAVDELGGLKEKYQAMQEELSELLSSRLLGKVSFLFLGANPDGVTQLRIARELHQVEAAIREAPLRSQILLRSDLAVGVDDLQRAFLAYRPQLIHFSGHGNRANALLVEGAGGAVKEIPPDSLSLLFRVFASQGRIRCVMLNACYSETQARAIAEHADAVGPSRIPRRGWRMTLNRPAGRPSCRRDRSASE